MTPDEWEDIFDNSAQVAALSVLCRVDFRSYIKTLFYAVNRRPYQFKPFHDVIIDKLQALADKQNKKKNLMLNLPVGSGKSLLIELFISWCFARTPSAKFAYVSHSQLLIEKLSGETKEILSCPEWIKMFGHVLRKDERSKTSYSFMGAGSRSGMTAGAMGSALTGIDAGNPNTAEGEFGGALIIDDPMDVDDVFSAREKEKVIRSYTDKLDTRTRTPDTPVILVMQRLAVDDLAAYILENERENWDVVKVAALLEDGSSFYPERFPVSKLEQLRDKNPFLFSGQYQQNPIVPGGNLFKDYMFIQGAVPQRLDFTFITVDTAYKDKQENDFTVISIWGVKDGDLYLLEVVRERLQAVDIEGRLVPIILRYASYGFMGTFIEPKGHGMYLNQKLPQLKIPMPSEEQIKEFFSDRTQDKVQRASKIIPFLAGRTVTASERIPKPLFDACKAELMSFPKAEHDDFVDTYIDAGKFAFNRPLSILDV